MMSLPIDPQTITVISEATALLIIVIKYGYDWYRCAMGTVYRCRMCRLTSSGKYKQIGTKLVPINKTMFNYGKKTYAIQPDRVLFNDPAPTLIYELDNAVPLATVAIVKDGWYFSAKRLRKLVKEEVVSKLANSNVKQAFTYESLVMGIVIGLSIGILLSRYLKF